MFWPKPALGLSQHSPDTTSLPLMQGIGFRFNSARIYMNVIHSLKSVDLSQQLLYHSIFPSHIHLMLHQSALSSFLSTCYKYEKSSVLDEKNGLNLRLWRQRHEDTTRFVWSGNKWTWPTDFCGRYRGHWLPYISYIGTFRQSGYNFQGPLSQRGYTIHIFVS